MQNHYQVKIGRSHPNMLPVYSLQFDGYRCGPLWPPSPDRLERCVLACRTRSRISCQRLASMLMEDSDQRVVSCNPFVSENATAVTGAFKSRLISFVKALQTLWFKIMVAAIVSSFLRNPVQFPEQLRIKLALKQYRPCKLGHQQFSHTWPIHFY